MKLDRDVLIVNAQIRDPKLLKHIRRGWIKNVSMSDRGVLTFLPSFPWWYRWWFGMRRWFQEAIRGK